MRPRPALTVTLDGLGLFGGDKPRALYAAVSPEPGLTDLQAEQERLVRRAGVEPERRKFTPHVTLARLRRDATPEAAAMYLSQAPVFAPLTFTVDRVTLFSARDSDRGRAVRGGGGVSVRLGGKVRILPRALPPPQRGEGAPQGRCGLSSDRPTTAAAPRSRSGGSRPW